jgi:hypothetical protein
MADDDDRSTEGRPQIAADAPTQPPAANTAYGELEAFRGLERNLTPEDLSSEGAKKLLLDKLFAAMAECARLRGFEGRFHEADKLVAVQNQRLNTRVALDIAWSTSIALGTMLLGATASLWELKAYLGQGAIVVGGVLIVIGILIRVVMR